MHPAALALARRNVRLHGLEDRVRVVESDLLDGLPRGASFDLILSNPPYVDEADRPTLQRELGFEPEMALFAPDRGLALATELLSEARRREALGCVLEIGAGQGAELVSRARAAGWRRASSHQDLAGHDRILIAF